MTPIPHSDDDVSRRGNVVPVPPRRLGISFEGGKNLSFTLPQSYVVAVNRRLQASVADRRLT